MKDWNMKKRIVAGTVVAVLVAGAGTWILNAAPDAGAGMGNIPAVTTGAAAPVQGAGTPIGAVETAPASPVMVAANKPVGPLDIQSFDRVLGSPTAPVTMIEYASFTCSHCAHFHNDVLPMIKKDWIDTGKVKYVFRDLPWDNLALGISKVARCVAPEQYHALAAAFFKNQMTIIKSSDPLPEVKNVAALAGLDGAAVDACIRNPQLHTLVEGIRDAGRTQLGITGTPTNFINGTKVEGFRDYKEIKVELEKAYAAATTR